MAFKTVVTYWATWDVNDHQGRISIKTDDNTVTWDSYTCPQEFAVVIDLLRNEKPLQWDKDLRQLRTFNETIGEGEPS